MYYGNENVFNENYHVIGKSRELLVNYLPI